MKIKRTQQMRLDELIKYVWEEDIEDTDFFSNEELPSGQKVKLHVNPRDFNYGESRKKAGVSLKSHGFVVDDRYTFTVEVEEEVTEETKFKELVITKENKARGTTMAWNCTIDDLSDDAEKSAVYAQVNGDLILIWSKYTGIPTEGVIECS